MDKYTIKETVIGARFYIFKNDLEMGYIKDEKDAQDYIAWKNQPRIDKEFKRVVLAYIENDMAKKETNTWMIDQFYLFIKAVKNLPTGEN